MENKRNKAPYNVTKYPSPDYMVKANLRRKALAQLIAKTKERKQLSEDEFTMAFYQGAKLIEANYLHYFKSMPPAYISPNVEHLRITDCYSFTIANKITHFEFREVLPLEIEAQLQQLFQDLSKQSRQV